MGLGVLGKKGAFFGELTLKGKKKIISLSLRAPPLPPFQTLSQVHPTALMLLEGTGQLGTVAMNWGDGFATDAAVVAAGWFGAAIARAVSIVVDRAPHPKNFGGLLIEAGV